MQLVNYSDYEKKMFASSDLTWVYISVIKQLRYNDPTQINGFQKELSGIKSCVINKSLLPKWDADFSAKYCFDLYLHYWKFQPISIDIGWRRDCI